MSATPRLQLSEGWKLTRSTRMSHCGWRLSKGTKSWFLPMGGFTIDRQTLLRTIAMQDDTMEAVTYSPDTPPTPHPPLVK